MSTKESGLTVGELVIGIGAIIIVSLVWLSFRSDDQSNKTSFNKIPFDSLVKSSS